MIIEINKQRMHFVEIPVYITLYANDSYLGIIKVTDDTHVTFSDVPIMERDQKLPSILELFMEAQTL